MQLLLMELLVGKEVIDQTVTQTVPSSSGTGSGGAGPSRRDPGSGVGGTGVQQAQRKGWLAWGGKGREGDVGPQWA